MVTPGPARGRSDPALRFEVEELLYHEADLLDRWELEAWLDLFVEDCTYSVPPTDLPDADPLQHTFLIHDDRFLLTQRVRSLLTKTAHAEWPHSRTRRLVTNVRATEHDGVVEATATFAVYRMRHDLVDCYVGTYRHTLVRADDGDLRFRHRVAVLDLESLRPQAKVSIII
jgi:p-cumate 2,3-dioxygenase subunit beta